MSESILHKIIIMIISVFQEINQLTYLTDFLKDSPFSAIIFVKRAVKGYYVKRFLSAIMLKGFWVLENFFG